MIHFRRTHVQITCLRNQQGCALLEQLDINMHACTFHRSGHRAGSAFVSSIVPNHPGNSVLRTYERIHISHALPHQHPPPNSPGMPTSIVPGVRRFNGPRALPPVVPAASQSDHSAGFYIFPPSGASIRNIHEAENPSLNHFHAWDSGWGSFHQATGGSDSGSRSSSFWRHWS